MGTPSTASVTITDDDTAQPGSLAFSAGSYSVAEDGGSVSINVNRSGGSDGSVSVDYATTDGSATAGTDYQPSIGTLDFGDAETSKSFVVSILDDAIYEDDESLQLSLSNVQGGATLNGITQATLTVTENDPVPPAGALEFVTNTFSELENSPVAVISVTRAGGSFGDVSVDYATSDGSATAGLDYQPTTGTLILADGQTAAEFELTLVDDSIFEDDETVNMTLANAQGGAGLGSVDSAVLTIVENDPEPPSGIVQFDPAIYDVAEDAADVVLSVIRTAGSNGQISVEYNSTDNSATAQSDYVAISGTLVFDDGELNKTITVTLIDDTDFEGDETFDVVLSDSQGGTLLGPDDSAIIRIVENDQPPPPGVIQFSGVQFDVNENDNAALITVIRTGGDSGLVTVDYATNDVTASAGQDYQTSVGNLVFADGVTSVAVLVPLLDDSLFEATEEFHITLNNVTGGAALGTPQSAVITINDNDPQPPAGSLQLSGSTLSVAEDGISVPITVVRTGGVFGDVSIDYTTVDGSATVANGDYQSAADTLTFASGVSNLSFAVTVFDDDIVEGNEVFDILLSNPQGGAAMGQVSRAEITIVENDFPKPGTLQFSAASTSATESLGDVSIMVTRINGSDDEISVEYSASGGTATSGSDYSTTSGILVFADGITNQSFTITIIDDGIVEPDETISFSLGNVTGGASLGDPVTIVVTINDNDVEPPPRSKSGGGAFGGEFLLIVIWCVVRAGRRRRGSPSASIAAGR